MTKKIIKKIYGSFPDNRSYIEVGKDGVIEIIQYNNFHIRHENHHKDFTVLSHAVKSIWTDELEELRTRRSQLQQTILSIAHDLTHRDYIRKAISLLQELDQVNEQIHNPYDDKKIPAFKTDGFEEFTTKSPPYNQAKNPVSIKFQNRGCGVYISLKESNTDVLEQPVSREAIYKSIAECCTVPDGMELIGVHFERNSVIAHFGHIT